MENFSMSFLSFFFFVIVFFSFSFFFVFFSFFFFSVTSRLHFLYPFSYFSPVHVLQIRTGGKFICSSQSRNRGLQLDCMVTLISLLIQSDAVQNFHRKECGASFRDEKKAFDAVHLTILFTNSASAPVLPRGETRPRLLVFNCRNQLPT